MFLYRNIYFKKRVVGVPTLAMLSINLNNLFFYRNKNHFLFQGFLLLRYYTVVVYTFYFTFNEAVLLIFYCCMDEKQQIIFVSLQVHEINPNCIRLLKILLR